MISTLLFVSSNDVQISFHHLAVLIYNQYENGADGVLTEWELYKMKVTTNLIHKEEDSLTVTSVSSELLALLSNSCLSDKALVII